MDRKLKICFFSGDITRSGGTERVSTVIANALITNKKNQICFLSLFEKRKETFYFIDECIKRFTLYKEEVSGAKHLPGFVYRIHQFVKKQTIDILIDIDGILDMYSIPALVGTKTKLISWEQFNYYQNPYVNYRKFTRKMAARKADAIVVLTEEDKGYYESNLKIKKIIKKIYNPIIIERTQYEYDRNSKSIISAGRLTNQKGFDILLDVAKIVLKKHPDWKWFIAGEGEDRRFLEEKISKYTLEGKIILCGNVDNIEEYYKKSAMYVLTSRYEGFGLVLTEAKTFHLPCVSFRCKAGPSEIIQDSVNGYLVDCFNVQEMAEKICNLIEDEDLRISFSEKALEDTEKFSLDKIVKEWEDLFEELKKND